MKNVQLPQQVILAKKNSSKKNVLLQQALLLLPFIFLIFMSSCKKTLQDAPATVAEAGLSTTLSAVGNGNIGINVLLNTAVTNTIVNELKTYGNLIKIFPEIKALTMLIARNKLSAINALTYVIAANPDSERKGSPVDAVAVTNFAGGISTWNLDAINVTQAGIGRTVAQDGTGVFVGVLDTGLPDSWRQYFPEERIAVQYAKSFGGGGGEVGTVSEQPNKWEHDQNGHGGHVTSTIIGFKIGNTLVNGVAPKATIIPVKILSQSGWGWSSVITQGVLYIASLKASALTNSPVIINMSLGGPEVDAVERAAMDYAISKGVIIVAAAGNSGELGMLYPGAYGPVISAAAAGLNAEFSMPNWWRTLDVPDPTNTNDFYLAAFSSRSLAGQDLDVTAPGSLVVGPYQLNSGQLSYYYLSGTSMACPHVAGIVALMAQKKSTLTSAEAETILQNAALPMSAGASAAGSGFITANAALDAL